MDSNNLPDISEPIKLDESPTGEEERDFFYTDQERAKAELDSLKQNTEERKKFAKRAYKITKKWICFLMVITAAQTVLRGNAIWGWTINGLSNNEFIAVFTTTTASVFGFWVLVGRYLFNSKAKS